MADLIFHSAVGLVFAASGLWIMLQSIRLAR